MVKLLSWIVPANKQLAGTNYNEWKAGLLPLHQFSKQAKAKATPLNGSKN
jgi:hypothetical protein